jgi:hypothetical protein
MIRGQHADKNNRGELRGNQYRERERRQHPPLSLMHTISQEQVLPTA